MRVSVVQDQASLYGLTVADVSTAVRVGFEGVEATKYRGGGDDEIDVIVRLEDDDRLDLDDLRNLRVATPAGGNDAARQRGDDRRRGPRRPTSTGETESG